MTRYVCKDCGTEVYSQEQYVVCNVCGQYMEPAAELENARTPELIACEINNYTNQAKSMVVLCGVEIGKRLIEAKAMLPHGEWQNWLKDSVKYSQSTANNFMKLYKEYNQSLLQGKSFSNKIESLGYSQALLLLSVAEDEREEFLEQHDVAGMSIREMKEELKKYKNIAEGAEEDWRMANEELEKLKLEKDHLEREVAFANNSRDEKNQRLNATQSRLDMEQKNLAEAQERIRQLEKKLAAPVTVEVETVPREVQEELKRLHREADEAQEHILNLSATSSFDALFFEIEGSMDRLQQAYMAIEDDAVGIDYGRQLITFLETHLEATQEEYQKHVKS